MKHTNGFRQGVTPRWPAPAVRFSALFALIVVGCGSPLLTEHHQGPPVASDAEVCAAEGKTWTPDGICQATSSLEISQDYQTKDSCEKAGNGWNSNTSKCGSLNDISQKDCAALTTNDRSWESLSGKCLLNVQIKCQENAQQYFNPKDKTCTTRPTLSLVGNNNQTVEAGNSMVALAFVFTPGATVGFPGGQNCPNPAFFAVSASGITSAKVDPTWTAASCSTDVVATAKGIPSQPVHVVVNIDAGFLGKCQRLLTSDTAPGDIEVEHTVQAMEAAVHADSCTDANTKLSGLNSLDLRGRNLTDLSPLASLSSLRYLYLQDNTGLQSVGPIAHLPALTLLVTGTPSFVGKPQDRYNNNPCPTDASVNAAVRNFCLRGDVGDDAQPDNQAPDPSPTPVPSPSPSPRPLTPPTFPTGVHHVP